MIKGPVKITYRILTCFGEFQDVREESTSMEKIDAKQVRIRSQG